MDACYKHTQTVRLKLCLQFINKIFFYRKLIFPVSCEVLPFHSPCWPEEISTLSFCNGQIHAPTVRTCPVYIVQGPSRCCEISVRMWNLSYLAATCQGCQGHGEMVLLGFPRFCTSLRGHQLILETEECQMYNWAHVLLPILSFFLCQRTLYLLF